MEILNAECKARVVGQEKALLNIGKENEPLGR